MTEITIRSENIGKQFQIGERQKGYRTFRETAMGAFKSPLRRFQKRNSKQKGDTAIWALKDVSFDVRQGEVVGIIGRNGAGKSTLLKILSRITDPTTGFVDIKGRLGSLLEVGTGFHPELSGRENIYLNGAILGMRRADIQLRFDEIVAFAEVEKFIDTAVKHYSTGMYLRLAFAVAAHLEPDILLVDEVLAVGDAAFQKKCLGRMGDIAREGRTVLFVSHNMGVLQTLCKRGILLEDGRVTVDDTAQRAVSVYLSSLDVLASQSILERTDRRGQGNTRLSAVEVVSVGELTSTTLSVGNAARFIFHLTDNRPGLDCRFTLKDLYGQPVVHFNSAARAPQDIEGTQLGAAFVCDIDEFTLAPGRYWMNVQIFKGHLIEDHLESAVAFDVEPGQVGGRAVSNAAGFGVVCLKHRWTSGPTN